MFNAPHFAGNPNILAHIRFNERTDAEGKKVLFLEELQSDWAQTGRKEGFFDSDQGARAKSIDDRIAKLREKQRTADIAGATDSELRAYQEDIARLVNERDSTKKGAAPAAPFVTDTKAWTSLALKRAIAYAVDHGFDKIAWTNGEQQSERYNLSKQIDKIAVGDYDGGYQIIARKNGDVKVDRVVKDARELAEVVGIRYEPAGAYKQPGFTITPEMKAQVQDKGMPLFSERRARNGDFSEQDHLVPNLEPWISNTQLVDLAYLGGKPIRLNVGADYGRGEGNGAMHLIENARRDNRRALDKETGEEGEDVVRTVLNALATHGAALHKDTGRYLALRIPMAKVALILKGNGDHYSITTMRPSAENKWGVAEWTGRLTFPVTEPAVGSEPTSISTLSDPLGGAYGQGSYVSAKFNATPPKGMSQKSITVVVKKKRSVAQEPSLDKGAASKYAGTLAEGGLQGEIVPQEGNDAQHSPPRSTLTSRPINATWTSPEIPGRDNFLRTMQDKLIDTKRVVQAIRDMGTAIKDTFDPYLQETLYHGRAAKEVGDFANNEIRPLLEEMHARGVKMQELEDYLWARHAKERNAQIARINPNMQDGGSGLTNAEASDVLQGLPVSKNGRTILLAGNMNAYAALARRIDAITKGTTDILVASGLETQDTVNTWRSTYQHYVPLMRDMEADDNYSGAFGLGTGQGFNVRGSASKRAMGSERDVENIFANVAMQRERAITRAEKNRIAKAVYGLALTAPNPDFWAPVNPELNKKLTPVAINAAVQELVHLGMNPIDAENLMREPVQQYINPTTGLVEQRVNAQLRGRNDVLAARINGEDRYVFFSSDSRAQQMVRNLKNLDAAEMGYVLQKVAPVTRYFASINTQYNPVFGLTNGIRDFGTAVLNLESTPLKGMQKDLAKHAFSALRGVYADLRDHRKGIAPTSQWAQLYEEFGREGGQTGYRDMFLTSKDRAEAIEKELKHAGKGQRWLAVGEKHSHLFGWLSDYNTSIENALRLSAYKVALDRGMSKPQAAALAKNLTVNFNKKGLAATQMGAVYAFFNAAMQGTARIAQTMFKDGKLTTAGKTILYGGMVLGVLQAIMGAAAGWDDDNPPQFAREKNFMIPIGNGKFLSVPYPLGFHVFPNIGRIAGEFALGGFKDPGKRMLSLANVVFDAFNPIGNGSFTQLLSPTITDPIVSLVENKDWTGKDIAKQDMDKTHPTPGWTRAKDTATAASKALAYALNYVSGGGKYGIGLASPTPDQIDYLVGQATGGVGREVMKAEQAAVATITGEELPAHKIPVAGRFYGETTGQASEIGRFYSNLKRIGEHKSAMELMKEAHDGDALVRYIEENPDARLVKVADEAAYKLRKLQTQKREALKRDASKEQIKMLEERITEVAKAYNERLKAR